MSVELHISGMTCDACARHATGALQDAGAHDISVDWRAGRATIDAGGASRRDLARALDGTKYRVERIVDPIGVGASIDGEYEYDLAIIGSGGGAFAAAIAGRGRDLRVVMVERGVVGGTCVNIGCIPSKALLAAAEARHRAAQSHFPGISTSARPVDMRQLVGAKDEIVGELRQSKYIDLAGEYVFELLEGDARFVEGPALEVDGRRIEAGRYVVATGAEPTVPDVPGLAEAGYLTSTTAMELDELPGSLIVIGGGYVAMEQAQLFAHLGSQVRMLVRSTLARGEEPQVAEAVRAAFEDDGIAVHEGVTADHVRRDGSGVVQGGGGPGGGGGGSTPGASWRRTNGPMRSLAGSAIARANSACSSRSAGVRPWLPVHAASSRVRLSKRSGCSVANRSAAAPPAE